MEETAQQMKRPFGIPEKPEFTVGLDEALKKLKMNVLSEGVSVMVLTGVGGSGKTTLATMICWDKQVIGKFKENILFVTFSKAPKLKIIVERLSEHLGYQVPELQSDGDAIDQLVLLLRKINANPMLLVLDDVWPGSETVVEKLKFQISDYKIVVTSRVALPRLGTSLVLKPLVPEDATTLFRNHAFLERESSNIPDEDHVQKVLVPSLIDMCYTREDLKVERICIPSSFVTLKNLKKLSLYLCDTREAFENSNMPISDAFPNLEELNIEYSKDMVGLPKGLCNITSLKMLSISSCHKLSSLPQEIGNLENLKVLRLNSCTDLEEIPNSVGRLSNLRDMDISNCINLPNLPEEFGNLCNLRILCMRSCARCELPSSIINLKNLKEVVCDEETAFSWEPFKPMLPNLKIDVPPLDVNLNWLHAIHS